MGLIIAKRFFSKEQFEEYNSNRPNVDFVSDLRTVLLEALGSLVPVGADALRGELDLFTALLDDLAKPEVSDFDLAIVKHYILRFQVVMDYFLVRVVQVLQPTQNLRNNQLCLLLRDLLVLLQIEIKVRPSAQFKNRAEAIVVDLDGVVLLNHSSMVQVLVDFIFSDCMLDIVLLDLLAPAVVEVVDLAGNLSAVLQVKRLVNL